MRIKTIIGIFVIIAFAVFNVDFAFSQYDEEMLKKMEADEELQQEFKWLKAETFVITASKVMEDIKKSAASITVVTDRQIRQMGARDLSDVLRIVPSFRATDTYFGIRYYGARGAGGSGPTNGILLMINSHPLNDAISGAFTALYDTLIVENIKRIEFIRGPGSALYGSNAFYGIINVITKDAEDIDGFELTARGGSWDTQQYNLLYGKTFSDLEVAFNFNYFKTHGFRGLIEEDFQTYLDGLSGSSASLAPGRMTNDDEKYEVALNLKYKGFAFDGRYIDREFEFPVGWLGALNNKSIPTGKGYYLNLCYETSTWEALALSGKVYRNYKDAPGDLQLFPPGYITLTPILNPNPPPFYLPEEMPNGMLYQGSEKDSRTGIEIQATYKLAESNTVVAGLTYEEMKWYGRKVSANYLPDPPNPPSIVFPLTSIQKWPDKFAGNTEKRNFKAFFFEDIWDLTDDIRLTTGVRYDRYSDFGGEVSPRVGLTWEYIEGYDLKLLYGHAFLAPSLWERYQLNTGNPDLDPEKSDTYELSLGAELTSSFNARITLYYRESKNTIYASATAVKFINLGKSRTHGFEFETKYDFGRGTYLSGNYSYFSIPSVHIPTGKLRRWGTPRHMGDIMANIRLSRYLNLNVDCLFEDGFKRDYEDDRDDMSGYAVVNSSLIAKKFLKGFEGVELRASVYNLLDKDYTSPQLPDRLPHDLPMPGRNYMVEMTCEF